MNDIQIIHKHYSELTVQELYELIKLRIDVFVVEQDCAYPELDGRDTEPDTIHSLAIHTGNVVGYARALNPMQDSAAFRIGRVVVAKDFRRTGLARNLMLEIIEQGNKLWPNRPIELSAQTVVIGFYQSLGFEKVSDEYLEDGIAHIDMRLEASGQT